jgi:hypothetical protein
MQRVLFSYFFREEGFRLILTYRKTSKDKDFYIAISFHKSSGLRSMEGYRTCHTCKQKVPTEQAILYGKRGDKAFCNVRCKKEYTDMMWMYREDSYDRWKEKEQGKEICSIIGKHDIELKDDSQRIDIKKFLHKHIECGEKL